MLLLKNIVIEDGIASADYYPECGTVFGHIEVDTKNEELLSLRKATDFGQSYIAHAIQTLLKMSKSSDHSSERTVMWY